MKILLIEDEKKVASFIKRGLEEEFFTVDVAYDGEKGEFMALTSEYDLIILDILLPKKNGLDVLKSLRANKINTPILILTAKGSIEDKVEGLNLGADDYLTKPFAFAELLARVRTLLRRASSEKSNIIKVADLELDIVKHTVKRGDKIIDLTAREFALLEYMIRNKGRVLTRTMIAEHIWDYHFDTGSKIIDVYIRRLRKKIDEGFSKKLIHTIRGVGYTIKEQ
ncbi:two component transcriptional regulator, winged helix family [Candidatus Kryptonium thompsonii]|nr:two component transcriptional regulator, winged helix family [Candidatus Kryptonium thompsoni]